MSIQGLPPQSGTVGQQVSPDARLKALENKVANRGAFGKFTVWLRNTVGLLTTDSQTMVSFRQALKDKVGDAAAQKLFKELELQPHRALTSRRAAKAIKLADDIAKRALAGRRAAIDAKVDMLVSFDELLEKAKDTELYEKWGPEKFSASLISTYDTLQKNGVPLDDPRVKCLGIDELVALHEYTRETIDNSFQNSLRSGKRTEAVEAQRNAMNSGLAKLPSYEGWVHRGVSIPESANDDYQRGKDVIEWAFISSAREPDGYIPASHKFAIYSRTGKDVQFLSPKQHEKEVLFRTETRFAIGARKDIRPLEFYNGEHLGRPNAVDIVMFEVDYV